MSQDKPTLNIQFTDFWRGFPSEDNFIVKALEKHFTVSISNQPDFVFCSIYGREYLKYDCPRIFFTGENLVPDFNLVDYGIGFAEMSLNDRYLRYPLYAVYDKAVAGAKAKHTHEDSYYLGKKKFCNYVISNALADEARDTILSLLGSYKTLDAGGKLHNNVGGPVPDKIAFEKAYKFSLAIENSSTPGYTTEKILEAFAGDTIPIYWGNPHVAKDFNPKAFINCHAFDSFEEMLERVKEIDENDELFLQMMKEPIVTEGSLAADYLSEDFLSDFLYRVCSQDPKAAIRRNTLYMGKYYEDNAKFAQRIDHVLKEPRRIWHGINNHLHVKKGK